MRAPLSWLREFVELPADEAPRSIAERLVRVGLEVETVSRPADDITGPLVVGDVVSFEDETHSNGKTIRWCQVRTGPDESHGIVCGATNFARGDKVVVALPGAVLPGGFGITARKTYGHVSDGMICSARELGVGDDHSGILVLPDAAVGSDAIAALGLDDAVLDIAVTPDRGYCLSIRGLARELATTYDVAYRDPGDVAVLGGDGGHPVTVTDPSGCTRFTTLTLRGLDPARPTPGWMAHRLTAAGMRPISLVVDITNYVMLELGQPLHAYDAAHLRGALGVRRAGAGETVTTLDGTVRTLDPADLVITDDSGAIGLAGVMGGATTEISAATTDVVLEAAHFDPITIAAAARRHKLPSEASRRFERGVDPALAPHAASRAAALLVEHGGATVGGRTDVHHPEARPAIALAVSLPAAVTGVALDATEVTGRLRAVGCDVSGGEQLTVMPPTWRPDLTDPYDLVEEVTRLGGYDAIPSTLPAVAPGSGLSARQRLRRRLGGALAARGYVETPCYPFVGPAAFDALGLPDDDARRRALALANPLSEQEPLLRTTLLPGLLAAVTRNVGRGLTDLALFETGVVFRPAADAPAAPRPGVDGPPDAATRALLARALPDQPERVAAVLAGLRTNAGWWGPGRTATWADAVEAAHLIAAVAGVPLVVRQDQHAPWHPGRCAALLVDGRLVGHAGELHPRVVEALGLPARTCAMELDLDRLAPTDFGPVEASPISTFPAALQDVAVVVDRNIPAADVEDALRAGAGPQLEALRLFDVYEGPQVGPGRRSLAYALRFRAADRTLTSDEVSTLRDAAVAEAARRTGATLRT